VAGAVRCSSGEPRAAPPTGPINLPTGSYTIYAQAEDSYGDFGDPDSLTLQVL
jgi:hypothetical protein